MFQQQYEDKTENYSAIHRKPCIFMKNTRLPLIDGWQHELYLSQPLHLSQLKEVLTILFWERKSPVLLPQHSAVYCIRLMLQFIQGWQQLHLFMIILDQVDTQIRDISNGLCHSVQQGIHEQIPCWIEWMSFFFLTSVTRSVCVLHLHSGHGWTHYGYMGCQM